MSDSVIFRFSTKPCLPIYFHGNCFFLVTCTLNARITTLFGNNYIIVNFGVVLSQKI